MSTNAKRILMAVALVAVLALAAAAAGVAAGRSGGSGGSTNAATVTGTVMLGPIRPVDRPEQRNWSYTKALVVANEILSGRRAAEVQSGSDGRFTMRLPPGDYRLVAMPLQAGMLPIAHPLNITVAPGATYSVKLWLDTGIRLPVNPGGPMLPAASPAPAAR
jgi:hypothetical protein